MSKYICSVCNIEVYPKQIVKDIVRDFANKQDRCQYWIDQECPHADNHFKILRQRKIKNIPLVDRQKVLDLFRSGKSIGEINIIMGFESDITVEIISMNITDIKMLRVDAI